MSAPVNILGISAFYHDSAACLVRDGAVVAAAQEERFTRKKHDAAFPRQAVAYCLREAGIGAGGLDVVAFYEKPFLKFDRILHTYLAYAPAGLRSFLMVIPLWIRERIWMKDLIRKELAYEGHLIFAEHHESHAAAAFFPSPFAEAAFLTVDGVGEWTTTSFGVGNGNRVEIRGELQFPHSLGLLYSAFTYFTGFKVNSGEYKLMGLAPLVAFGLVLPKALKPVYVGWMALALALGFVVSHVILTAFFFLVIIPIGLAARPWARTSCASSSTAAPPATGCPARNPAPKLRRNMSGSSKSNDPTLAPLSQPLSQPSSRNGAFDKGRDKGCDKGPPAPYA